MKVKVKLVEGLTSIAETESGHGVVIDTSEEHGSKNLGPTLMELLLAGVAACTAFDVALIPRKMRQPLEGLQVIARAKRREEPPRVFTEIHLEYVVKGRVNEEKVKRAIELSRTTWCSASNNLEKGGTRITYSYEIIPPEQSA